MYHNIEDYLSDVREIEAMFTAHNMKESNFDSDVIEDILCEWQQFIDILRDEGETALANRVYEKIEEIEERLRDYEQEQIKQEEKAVIEEASNRLSRSAMENLIAKPIEMKNQPPDIGREHQAEFRLRNRAKDFPERLKRLEE